MPSVFKMDLFPLILSWIPLMDLSRLTCLDFSMKASKILLEITVKSFQDLVVPDPVRPGLISTHRSSPGSSSDLLTPSRPEDTAHRLPADLPPFHYSSLMTSHALNYNGWDYDPCRLSSDGRLRVVVMDPLFRGQDMGKCRTVSRNASKSLVRFFATDLLMYEDTCDKG